MTSKSVQIGIRVSPAVSASLEKEAAERGLTKTSLVTTIVYDYVRDVIRKCES